MTYNALGQRVQEYQGTDPMTLTYPRDIFGQRTGTFAQWPSQNWTGWNVYWSQIAGQRLNMGGADAYIDHSDAVGSTTMETDPAGAVQWDVTHYPWGRVFQEQGIRQSEVVMGLDWQVNDPVIPSATREFNFRDYRWMTPDPDGGHLENPQTLNKYTYAGNNPTSLNDPSGRDFYLACTQTKDNSNTCQQVQNGSNTVWVQGTTNDKGKFEATVVRNGEDGALVDQAGNRYTGTFNGAEVTFVNQTTKQSSVGNWELNSDPTTGITGVGDLGSFSFTFVNHNAETTLNGTFLFAGSHGQAATALEDAGFVHWGAVGIHWGGDEFRLPAQGRNSSHFIITGTTPDPKSGAPRTNGEMHTGEYYPGLNHWIHDWLKLP